MIESLAGTFVGALLAFAVLWWATPRVERRYRAQTRTEEAYFQLLRLLTEEAPPLRQALRSAYLDVHSRWLSLGAPQPGVHAAYVSSELQRVERPLFDAHEAWSRYRTRIDSQLLVIGDEQFTGEYWLAASGVPWLSPRILTDLGETVSDGEVEWEARAREVLCKVLRRRVTQLVERS